MRSSFLVYIATMESKNEKAKAIVWLRQDARKWIFIDEPCELGYHCPLCKYKQEVDGHFDERLKRSEYNGFLRCSVCNKDYPSCLCMPDIDNAIDIYLDCVLDTKQPEPAK